MTSAVFRSLSELLALLPVRQQKKEALKAFFYRHFGVLFRRSPNYAEWRRSHPKRRSLVLAPSPQEPSAADWDELVARRLRGGLPVPTNLPGNPYVVVPVFRGRRETLACLYSACLAAPSVRIVVIDDATPDLSLGRRLVELAADGHFELIRNASNQGFLRSVNLGFDIDPEADVVILNSDTAVFGDWLDRMNAAACRSPDIGTVTPLSNNGDIASYPHPRRDNQVELEVDFAEIDGLARTANVGRLVDAPTGVGFCLYIRRDCLGEVGGFDEHFRAGYGEENDFCLRAAAKGWRSVIAEDVFVRHTGGVSFARHAPRLRRAGMQALVSRHPNYEDQVDVFLARDPLAGARARIDAARLRRQHPVEDPERALLFVVHNWGGGVEQHVEELASQLAVEGVAVYQLRVRSVGHSIRLDLVGPPGVLALQEVPGISEIGIDGSGVLVEALMQLGIEHVHVHHLGDFSAGGPTWLGDLCAELGVSYDVTAHDYASICPRLHLERADGRYCGEPDEAGCTRCLGENGTRFGDTDIESWRAEWREFLARSRAVICPTEDVHRRLAARWPDLRYRVRPHPEPGRIRFVAEPSRRASVGLSAARDEASAVRLRVLIPGAINEQKGFGLLLDCARDARKRALPLEFWIVGYSRDDVRAEREGIIVTGRFASSEADDAIRGARGDQCVAFLPSLTPETWSFMLSSVLRVGVHPVAFDLGALAERIRVAGRGTLLPFEWADRPERVNDALLELGKGENPAITLRAELGQILDRASDEASAGSMFEDYYGLVGIVE
jgi:GT2 family glycosyltransferase/glycosyltransferase involved in cell wall biosynthesis